MHSRQRAPSFPLRMVLNRSVPSRRTRSLLAGAALLAVAPVTAAAQRADSARVAPRPASADSTAPRVLRPPLSPRRAFLYSLLLPGYGQSVLGRPGAGTIFVLTESIAIAMLRESRADLAEARALKGDSLVVIGVDPSTGQPITQRSSYDQELIDVRRGHVEDWVAFLVANHLFAAADAYVAAHLWDLPAQISVRQGAGTTVVAARFAW